MYYDKRSCYGPSGSLSSSRNILVRIAQLTPDLSIELPVSLQYGCPQSLDVAVWIWEWIRCSSSWGEESPCVVILGVVFKGEVQGRALFRPEGFSVVVRWVGWVLEDLLDVLNVVGKVVEAGVVGVRRGDGGRPLALVVVVEGWARRRAVGVVMLTGAISAEGRRHYDRQKSRRPRERRRLPRSTRRLRMVLTNRGRVGVTRPRRAEVVVLVLEVLEIGKKVLLKVVIEDVGVEVEWAGVRTVI